MSQFPPALDFILNNEDRNREYAIVPDKGGQAIAGINSHYWPTAFANISRLPQGERGPAIANFYKTEFWDVMRLGGINSQDLANRVLDEGVNAGPYTACRMLQQAVNQAHGWNLTVDGILGPDSLTAINDSDSDKLIAVFGQLRQARYKATPGTEQEHAAWEARARA